MTREEAMMMLIQTKEFLMGDKICWSKYDCHIEAIDMAIEALQTLEAVERIKTEVLPQTDLVRCKDCRHFKKIVERSDSGVCYRDIVASVWKENSYCSRGERREP